MQRLRVAVVVAIVVGALPLIGESSDVQSVAADSSEELLSEDESDISLSPIWGANIRQWSSQIAKEALAKNMTIRDLVIEEGLMDEEEADRVLDPATQV